MASKVLMITALLIVLVGIQGCGSRGNNEGSVSNPEPNSIVVDGGSLIINSDFENESEIAGKWYAQGNGSVQLCDIGRNGSKAAVITLSQGYVNSGLDHMISWTKSSDYLLVRGWVKCEQTVGHLRFRVTCGNDKIQYDRKGREIYGCLNSNEIIHPLSGSEDWHLLELGIYVPDKTIDISVSLWAHGTSGRILIDDIEVRPAKLKSNNSANPD
jgi:hypothetical protein